MRARHEAQPRIIRPGVLHSSDQMRHLVITIASETRPHQATSFDVNKASRIWIWLPV
jgi:hypothetical protein